MKNRTLKKISSFVIRYSSFAIFSALALIISGCAYHLGPTNGVEAGEKTIQINPFDNQTLEPRLGDAATTELRKQIQHDGTYRLATHGHPDIIVSAVITRFNRHELSLLPHDVLTARDYRLNVTAQVTARDTTTGKIIFDKPVTGYTLIRVGNDITSTERQAIPLLAEDLAKNIAGMLVDGTW